MGVSRLAKLGGESIFLRVRREAVIVAGDGKSAGASSTENNGAGDAAPRRRLLKPGSIGILEPDDYDEPRPDELGGKGERNGHEETIENVGGGDEEHHGSGEEEQHGSGEEGSGEGSGEETPPNTGGVPTVRK